MKKLWSIIAVLSFLSACAPNLGGSDYYAGDVGSVSKTLKGVIIAARKIKIHGNRNEAGTGAAAGAVSGALLGSTLGGGHKTPLATGVLGGLAGGFAGHVLEKKMTEQDGMEYQIKLADGNVITLAQAVEPMLTVGQRVLVIESSNSNVRSRVIPDNT